MFEGRVTEDEPDYIRLASPEAGGEIYVGHGVSCTLNQTLWFARPAGEAPADPRAAGRGAATCFQAVVEEVAYMGNLSIYRLRLETGKVLQATKANLAALRRRRDLLGREGLGDLGRHRGRGADAMSAADRAGAAAALDGGGCCAGSGSTAAALVDRGAAALAAGLLPDPVPRRRQDQPQRGGDRACRPTCRCSSGTTSGALRHAELRQLRLPVRRPALPQRLPVVAQDRLRLGGDRAPRRLSDGLLHRAQPRAAALDPADAGDPAVLDLVPAARLRLAGVPALERGDQQLPDLDRDHRHSRW